jgi:hypothetical protein
MIPITMIDITGLQIVREVIEDLRTRGSEFIGAGRAMKWKLWAESRRLESGCRSFPTLRAAIKTYKREIGPLRDVRKTA